MSEPKQKNTTALWDLNILNSQLRDPQRADFVAYDDAGNIIGVEFTIHSDLKAANVVLTVDEFKKVHIETLERALASPAVEDQPPPWAEFLLALLASKKTRKGLLGDYEEEFHLNSMKPGGKQRARRIYWAGVLQSVMPLVWSKLKSAGLFGLVLAAFKYFSR